ncbi:DUF5819 family protein [Streptomyces sp. NPDC090057]|uniref:DUF5819 family protein n=1 Tax=Streptomyces sp. NPDC090057 TaxID=3365935 RepID=UPI0037F828F8
MDQDDGLPADHGGGPTRVQGLSPVSRAAIALSVVGVLVAVAVHSVVLFLDVAPSNALSRQHAAGIAKYAYPEFTQNWQFFAPEPTSANTHVQARVKIVRPNGVPHETPWVDLTAMDERWIRHNPFPSQAQQNQLRNAWGNFVSSLDGQGRPAGQYGQRMQQYLLRTAVQRFGAYVGGGTVRSIQVRSASTPIAAPPGSGEHVNTTTGYLVEPWWTVRAEDFQ